MSIITLTLNVNLATAKMGTPVDIFTDKILGVASMATTGTVLIMNGGATLPIKETKEQIYAAITAANNNIEGVNDGTK